MPKNADEPTGGQHPALATKGKAHATGTLDVLRPGDPGHGGKTQPPPKRGLRAESDKMFQLSEDHKPGEMIRVYDADPDNKKEDVVLFSGTRKQAENAYKALGEFLKK